MLYVWLILSVLVFGVGEYLSKQWAQAPSWQLAALITLPYAIGSLLWLPALLHKNHLATVGTAWSVLSAMVTVGLGWGQYDEKITVWNGIGIGLAIVAMMLLQKQ